MLQLKGIVKNYLSGENTVHALKGIDLCFRDRDFVSILGPSGCGKTTMLNIIGGLDGYTSGDLVINGRSTKNYSDRDWDTYRNHSIGFVFQSYNLIPHQSVLSNVELALTLSGESRTERRNKARAALEKVGLGNQLHKRPNELSGGQMQRVAIARAIVNNPDIILADEPTGALDTETGIQVMEILKEISKDRLIIMVTHNPELAAKYSTRTITMLDGLVTGDSSPLTEEEKVALSDEEKAEKEKPKKREKKPSMSIFTSFGLSLNNLFTKKGRTILTSFAGSIGIIGIALIYAVSQGATDYINLVQEETLTAYPLTLESETVDLSSLIESFLGKAQSAGEHENDAVYQKAMIYSLVNTLTSIEARENDLSSFKRYLEAAISNTEDETGLREAVSGVQYTYGLNLQIYTENTDGKIIHSDVTELMSKMMMANMSNYTGMSGMSASSFGSGSGMSSSMASSYSTIFQEMLPGKDGELISDIFDKQYDLIYGSWPSEYNEIVLVVDEKNEIPDLSLYALGLLPESYITDIFKAIENDTQLDESKQSWTYEDICSGDYRVILNCNCYQKDTSTGNYSDLRETEAGLKYLFANGVKLRVSGIIRAKEDTLTTILTGAVGYTSALSEYIINQAHESEVVKLQQNDAEKDIFTGLTFKAVGESMTEKQKAKAFRENIYSLSASEKAAMFISVMSIPTDEYVSSQVGAALMYMTREDLENTVIAALQAQMSIDAETLKSYIEQMSDEELTKTVSEAIAVQVKEQYAQKVAASLSTLSEEDLAESLDSAIGGYSDRLCAEYYDETAEYSNSDYESNLIKLGCFDLTAPTAIFLYASSFEDKDALEKSIADYNETVPEEKQIEYTDYVGIMMSSVTTIIDAITYVLIAFVAISLIVSSIMIGVITLISVQERTKEIGILRAIGATKANVSSMFNAETVIIGFTSGIFGVGITYLLCIPIDLILHKLTGIGNLSTDLPIQVALILIGISVLLTLISGIIPSRSAAKKDPVVALRTE